MSSVMFFTPYVDKENTTAHGVRPKTFTGNKGGKLFTPACSSRRALKDVNQDVSRPDGPHKTLGLRLQASAPVNKLFQDPVMKKPLHEPGRKPKSIVAPLNVVREKTIVRRPDPLPDIEHMHIYDDSADVKSVRDHDLAGVVERLIRWRPPCLFGTRPDDSSDEEDGNDDDLSHLHLELPEPIPIGVFEENLVVEDVSEPDIDMAIPFLDDTLDMEDNFGSLIIYGGSTPQLSICPSPNVKLTAV